MSSELFRNPKLSVYNSAFADYYPRAISGFVEDFENTHERKPIVLNLFSQSRALRELETPGLSVSFEFYPEDPYLEMYPSNDIAHITTDLNDLRAMAELLDRYLIEEQLRGFDLVFARPVSQDRRINSDKDHIKNLFQIILNKMTVHGLLIYHGTPGKIVKDQLLDVLKELEAEGSAKYELINLRNVMIGFCLRKGYSE